ncbi:MAG: hypothetical protein Q8N23_25955 [Archangium sp.]|nr:hypothetical protein [Archangium sp.]MDP3156146.1 hypothetical protein [Archangium sp.]MDP3571483.1 hypothetical protein [Archangium sp.]
MKRRALAVVLSIAAAFTVARALMYRSRSSPLSGVLTAKSGSFTAVTSEAMWGLEWSEDAGRVGVSTATGTPSWSPRSEAEVRALAAQVIEPVLVATRSTTADRVVVFAICDGVGVSWEGVTFRAPGNY